VAGIHPSNAQGHFPALHIVTLHDGLTQGNDVPASRVVASNQMHTQRSGMSGNLVTEGGGEGAPGSGLRAAAVVRNLCHGEGGRVIAANPDRNRSVIVRLLGEAFKPVPLLSVCSQSFRPIVRAHYTTFFADVDGRNQFPSYFTQFILKGQ
jgi:hypothetical protein